MIRKDDYKLIYYPKIDKALLFNLANDPEEMHDLSVNPEYLSILEYLFQKLRLLQKEVGDPLDVPEQEEKVKSKDL